MITAYELKPKVTPLCMRLSNTSECFDAVVQWALRKASYRKGFIDSLEDLEGFLGDVAGILKQEDVTNYWCVDTGSEDAGTQILILTKEEVDSRYSFTNVTYKVATHPLQTSV